MNVASAQKPHYRAKNSRSACPLAHDEQGALSQVQKTTATIEGARVHPALLLRIVSRNGALRRRHYVTYMGSPKPISKGQGERHTVIVVA